MESDWWLELDQNYASVIKQRLELYAKHGKLVLQYLPGAEIACKELMEMILQFLCGRYPQYFTLCREESGRWTFVNKILGVTTVLDGRLHPLEVIINHVPEDFGIMLRDPDTGMYHLRAGVICSAMGWSLDSKIGKMLHEVHEPVPDYAEKMRFSMDRYFAKKPTDKPIQRGSWGLELDKPLFMPPGDPHEKFRDVQLPEEEVPLSRVHLRVDWQTLRRLPLSGAVVFNFKALFTPITELRDEPYLPALVLRVLEQGKENIMKYKNSWHVEHVAKPALAAWAKEQEDAGVVVEDWEVHTLDDSPFFPGWEDKWRRQQGF